MGEKHLSVHYNRIAGQSLDRLAALSDGIFAVAMTLLVLNLHVPVSSALASEHAVWELLVRLWPSLLAYGMSFLTLGIFWVGQQTQLDRFARSDRWLTWIHLAFLLAVTLMPFSTGLLAVLLCILSNYVSIALIILVQVAFGVAPRFRW